MEIIKIMIFLYENSFWFIFSKIAKKKAHKFIDLKKEVVRKKNKKKKKKKKKKKQKDQYWH